MSVSDKEWFPCHLHTSSDRELIIIRSNKAKLDSSLPRKFGIYFGSPSPYFLCSSPPFFYVLVLFSLFMP